jgi:hypothetical protein
MLVLNTIVIDSLNKISKLFSKLIPHWPTTSQLILFENIRNIFSNLHMVMNPLLITQIHSYSLSYTQKLPVCYPYLGQCVVMINA